MEKKIKVMVETFYIANESCVFTFDGQTLRWRDNAVPLANILIIDYVHSGNCCPKEGKANKILFWRSSNKHEGHDTIIIHYALCYKRSKLRKLSVKFQGDSDRLSLWLKELHRCLEGVSSGRPKKVLTFINPYSGKQNGVDVYMKKVKPLLELAKIQTCVVVTRNSGDFDKVICSGIDSYDTIFAVGGDGTISILVNALIRSETGLAGGGKTGCEVRIPKIKIPIAIIPCGSTDCIAYSMNGTRDTETHVLHAMLGHRRPCDVCRVSSGNAEDRFFVSVFTYGYLTDLVVESEKFRWMGPIRYNYAGFLTLLRSREYFVRLNLLCETPTDTTVQAPHSPLHSTSVVDKDDECKLIKFSPAGEWKTAAEDVAVDPLSVILWKPIEDPFLGKPEGCFLPIPEKPCTVVAHKLEITGAYFLIACANISCASELIPNGIAPNPVPGCMSIVLFQPRHYCDLYKIYMRLVSKDKNLLLSDLPFVHVYNTRRVEISIESDKEVSANCDGELYHHSHVTIELHRNVIQFYGEQESRNGKPGG